MYSHSQKSCKGFVVANFKKIEGNPCKSTNILETEVLSFSFFGFCHIGLELQQNKG